MRILIPMVAAALLVAACGYKGPLYLPKSKPEAQKPVVKPAPAQDETKPEGM
jgi:predicted small lipoprotein YifL